ncbi:MAG TPA: lysophospholipid acyltransferase family protein [Verrucomicrobiae bacterium]|nr:lysophospholipid acyltransferase family protein [Verrucomicrobiae bacterium]
MLRTVIWLIYFGLHTLFTLYHLLIVYILGAMDMKAEQEDRISSTARNWAKALIKVSGTQVEVFGAEHVPADKSVLFVGNHQSDFDIPLYLGFIPGPKGFIAKIELSKAPVVSTWMTKMHCLFMDRKNLRQSVTVMRQAVEYLKSGYSLVIFPEGTRSKSSAMLEFKRGSLSIAEKAGVPIIPVTVVDSYKILEANKGFRITPAYVEIHISEPIYPADLPPDTDLAAHVRSIIASKLPA